MSLLRIKRTRTRQRSSRSDGTAINTTICKEIIITKISNDERKKQDEERVPKCLPQSQVMGSKFKSFRIKEKFCLKKTKKKN